MSVAKTFASKLFFKFPANNFKNITRYYPAPIKRCYEKVHVLENDGKFEITLDKRKLKTPLGNLFQVYSEPLAIAVATEWDLQGETIQQCNMHLTALCNTAIDNPCRHSTETTVDETLQYLVSDTLCFRLNEPPEFLTLQKEKWDPIIKWFQDRYNVKIEPSADITSDPVPQTTYQEIKRQLLSYNDWCLLGIHFGAENLKSLILTLAVINHEIKVESAVNLSRLETDFQVEKWGEIEWSHSIDKVQVQARVAAASLFTYFNQGSFDLKRNYKKISKAKTN